MFQKKKFSYLLLIFVFGVIPIWRVDAVELKMSYDICYNSSTGKYVGTGCDSNYTTYKYFTIGGKNVMAYCSQLSKYINNVNYTKTSGWDTKSKEALIAGKCIELANSKYNTTNEKFLYSTELVNYVFKNPGYKDFVTQNKDLIAIYEEAHLFVTKTAKYSGSSASKLPTITLVSEGSNDMNSTSKSQEYISNKIILSGLVDNFGSGNSKNNGDTTYKISASGASGTTVYICDDVGGTKNCQTSVILTKPSSATKNFYLKIVGASAGGDVKVTVSGSNKSTYPTVTEYNSNEASQTLMIAGSVNISRSVSATLSLSIPDNTKHTIKVTKVDEEGNELTGAELVLYKANLSDTTNKQVGDDLAKNSNGSATLSYSVTKSEDNDDFFNWQYCVQESKSPKGFILKDSTICYKPTNSNSKTCLNGSGEVMSGDDANYCGATYTCDGLGEDYIQSGDGTKCEKDVTVDAIKTCAEGSTLNNDRCETLTNDPVTDEGTGSLICAEGSTLVDGKCYIYTTPNEVCNNGVDSPTDGKCLKTEQVAAKCVGSAGEIDRKYCESTDQYMSITQNGGNLTLTKINNKTSVTISKKAATGDEEISGAALKICSNKPDSKGKCDVVTLEQKGLTCPSFTDELDSNDTNVSNCTYDKDSNTRKVNLEWVSSDVPRSWSGLEAGKTYYLVEVTPPSGYISVTTATEFTIETDGTIKTGSKSVSDNIVVIRNKLTQMSISKDDIATSEEIPGATLSICESHINDKGELEMSVDDHGDCTVVTLADGSAATWVSGKESHKITGLPIGTYYLVEQIAPKGYSTAESVIFTMKEDGTLTDKDGKSLKDNNLVMHDKKISEVKTGMLGFYVVSVIVVFALVGSVGSYFFLKRES